MNKWEIQHRGNVSKYVRSVDALYGDAAKEIAKIGASSKVGEDVFSFASSPRLKSQADRIVANLRNSLQAIILNGMEAEWTLANSKNNELCNVVFGDNAKKLTEDQRRRYYSDNGSALDAFKLRKAAGLDLSGRVWNYAGQFESEMEMGLDVGIRNGLSASEMARDLRQYLKYPDKLFRRVRDMHGNLGLSKAAREFNPGQGVYRSSYKNALRLAMTETNMAYRKSDHLRWQQLDFVVGIEVSLSYTHPRNDICDELAGRYPKNFEFIGWHSQCRCYAESILKSEEEMDEENSRLLDGEEPSNESVNRVEDVPSNFKEWVRENDERIAKSNARGTLPYFLQDNRQYWSELSTVRIINQNRIGGAVDYAGEFARRSESLAEKLGIMVTPTGIKSESRIYEKAVECYDGDVSKVSDIIRNTFVAEGGDVGRVVEAVRRDFAVVHYEKQNTALGYSGDLLQVWAKNGIRAEIQVNTPQMIYGKELKAKEILGGDVYERMRRLSGLPCGLGHRYYEEYRVMSDAEKRSARGIDIARKSREYYDRIRAVRL